MTVDTFRLETTLDARDLARLKRELEAAEVDVSVDGASVLFTDARMGQNAQAWIERLMDYNARLHRAAKREGRPLVRYKPRDDVNLIVAVCKGLQDEDETAILHEVIWRQPFPNANHRTATAAVIEELSLASGMDDLQNVTDPIFEESKKLLDGSDTSLTDDEAKQIHHDLMVRLYQALQSIK